MPQGSGGIAPARDDAMDRRREAIATEILKIGASMRRALATGNVDAVMARVPAAGLRCGERVVPRARVDRDLRTRGSWLHEVLFGDTGPSPRAPRSLRSFLNTVPDAAMVVSFRRDPTAGPVGTPCLDYRAEGFTTPGSPLCFERRDGAWWLVDSLYPCS
jgi:hypothetical protein